MNKEEVLNILQANGFQVKHEKRLGNDKGHQIKLMSDGIVNVYDSGKVNVQGKNQEPLKKILGLASGPSLMPICASSVNGNNRNVFVVYGHDQSAKTELEAMLRRWGMNPLILDQLPSGGQTIIEKLESNRSQANFAVVLATPDDEGHRAGMASENAFRARQNVVLELGMMLATLGRPRVAILMKDQEKMERPSDIQGLIYIPFRDSIYETALLLAKEINGQGIPIDLNKL